MISYHCGGNSYSVKLRISVELVSIFVRHKAIKGIRITEIDTWMFDWHVRHNWGAVHTYPDTFESLYLYLSGYAFRQTRIRWIRRANPETFESALQSETFESDIFSDTCGRLNPDTFESDDVARSGLVSTVVSTAWLQKKHASQPKRSCCSCWAESSSQDSQSVFLVCRWSFIFYTRF